MKRIIVFSILFAALGCSATRDIVVATPANEKEFSITADISLGETIALKIPAQLSTGYSWNCTQPSDVAAETGKGDVITAGKDIVGAFDTQVIYLKGVKVGSGVLVYQYIRKWENETKPEKTLKVSVTVK